MKTNFTERASEFMSSVMEIVRHLPYSAELNYNTCSVTEEEGRVWVKWGPYNGEISNLPITAIATIADNIFRDAFIKKEQELYRKMYEAENDNIARILTKEDALMLRGKKISTIYFGYKGQDGVDEFIVGDVKRETHPNGSIGRMALFTEDGRCTNMFLDEGGYYPDRFYCTDADRYVYFVENDEEN